MPNKQHTMHGRDHEHGAADPTLIHWADTDTGGGASGGSAAWALYTGGGVTVPAPGTTPVGISLPKMAYGPPGQTAFGLAHGTGGFSSLYGVTINEAGVYKATWHFEFSTFTDGDTIQTDPDTGLGIFAYWADSNQARRQYDRLLFNATTATHLDRSHVFFVGGALWTSGVTLPRVGIPRLQSIAGFHTFTCDICTVFIEQLSTSYVTNAPSETP
jgi:hypothetical protein